jgi:hypothetical protein
MAGKFGTVLLPPKQNHSGRGTAPSCHPCLAKNEAYRPVLKRWIKLRSEQNPERSPSTSLRINLQRRSIRVVAMINKAKENDSEYPG